MTATTNTESGLMTDHTRATADDAHTHGDVPSGSRADRATSFELADFAVPNGREEDWRFTPVDRLQQIFAGELGGAAPDVTADTHEAVTVESVPRDDARLGAAGAPGDRAAAAAWAGFSEATVVTVPKNHVSDTSTPTTLNLTGSQDASTGAPAAQHVLVVAEELSESLVLLDHRGGAHLTQTVEIDVRDGAKLTVVSIQDWSEGAVHVASHRAKIGRDAKLKHIVVTLGGDVVRVTPDAEFTAPGGEVEMIGLYFTDAGQHQEHRLFVDHAVPHCTSNVTYKGALQGAGAHAVWVGDVLIRKEAEGTDTYELNRNLLLTEGARADSVPNLEIETGEIEGAGHASATGRFDDEQLFYLRSRGIPEIEARRLVVRGFFAELINQIGVPVVVERLLGAIEAELEKELPAS
ncbi:Fe-S cluster assembly protein SufD [Bogoriella caseilytica]|uniref:Iron-regulated ABC transporter permease protein SufD n=1 Tax=Bogoriella caseilytica TaxID=56055 RepID=A0A3N2BG57_9MICO|nr:Fe-S cluster assembly protein SufD [Bogoriella caseilytica]ROR74243.1 iron-regulated ABC transporter permease protein SufD [Bogoriella caseilytica]